MKTFLAIVAFVFCALTASASIPHHSLRTNGVSLTASPIVISHYFDPEYEFLELGVREQDITQWKIMGPDMDGVYGGQNGTGGFDGIAESFYQLPTVADVFGNVYGAYDIYAVDLQWNSSRVSGYGGIPGFRPVTLGSSGSLADKCSWRNRAAESVGYVWMGANWYNPETAQFLKFDEEGFTLGLSTGLNTFNGNPIGLSWDHDGRFGKKAGAVAGDILMSLVASALTPKPSVPYDLLTPQQRAHYDRMAQMTQDAIGHPFQNAGVYDANSGAAATRDIVAMTVQGAALAKAGQSFVNVNVTVPQSPPTITQPYVRPTGATTAAQRAAVQGQPCVDCGKNHSRMVADHKTPLVVEYYGTGTIDLGKMKSVSAVQPQCPTCSGDMTESCGRLGRQNVHPAGE